MHVIDLPAQQGGTWIKDAFTLFRGQPAAWVALTAVWFVLLCASMFLPIIGGVIAMLQPAFFAGFALACRDQENGARVRVGHLFAALRANPRPLVMIGAISTLLYLLLVGLVYQLGAPWPLLPPAGSGAELETVSLLLQGREWIVLLYLLLDSLVRALLWFTAPLLAFNRMSAWDALRWSVYASLSNVAALIVFGALMALLFALAFLTGGLGLVVVLPLLAIANYSSYRRVFSE